jgi:hypothetical protein
MRSTHRFRKPIPNEEYTMPRRSIRSCSYVAFTALSALAILAAQAAEADGIYKPIFSDSELGTMVAADAKIITDTLAKGAPDKKALGKIRAAALMVATYAQGAGDSQAGLRDIALKIGKAANAGKIGEIKKLAAELKPGAQSAGAKTGYVSLEKEFDLADLMQQFKPETGGGLALEKTLQTLTLKRAALTPAEIKTVHSALLRTAAIAQPCEAYAPERDEGQKTKEQWVKLSKEMGELSMQGAALAKAQKPDDQAIKAVLKKIEANCVACHQVYRD